MASAEPLTTVDLCPDCGDLPVPATARTSTTSSRPCLALTGQHGRRFKRFRVQSNGVKEVPEEQVSMWRRMQQLMSATLRHYFLDRPSSTQVLPGPSLPKMSGRNGYPSQVP